MVEAEEDPSRRCRHSPSQPRQQQPYHQQYQYQRHYHQNRASSSGRMASQSRLHNFSFPSLSWGNQRLLRCIKIEGHWAEPGGGAASHLHDRGSAGGVGGKVRLRARDWRAEGEEEEKEEEEEEDARLDKFKAAMMAEFRKAFDRIPLPSPPPSGLTPTEQKKDREKLPAAEVARPWNLRIRRAACNAPAAAVAAAAADARPRLSLSAPEKNSAVPGKYVLRSDAGPPKEERKKFSPVLSKEEIEVDFYRMTTSKPPRRPKKRPRIVQKQVENLFPGFYLTEVTPDLYKNTEDK